MVYDLYDLKPTNAVAVHGNMGPADVVRFTRDRVAELAPDLKYLHSGKDHKVSIVLYSHRL